MSFNLLRGFINEVADDLGGFHARQFVAQDCENTLREITSTRMYGSPYTIGYQAAWTLATDADFEQAVEKCKSTMFRIRDDYPLNAEVPFRGAMLRQRLYHVFLEGKTYGTLIAMTSEGAPRSRDKGKWHTFLSSDAKILLHGMEKRFARSTNPTSVVTKSGAGAVKSLRNLVEKFFAVEFINRAS